CFEKWGHGLVNIVFLGPSEWYKDYPIAEGNRQSPIDIVPAEAVFDARLSPISLSYNNCTSVSISNNGHSVVVEFIDSDERSVMLKHIHSLITYSQ
uniref:Alpha-carbonic anhydrase domain-containing protein n=1 Tax=Sinocyclocheilus rhinocerous TaxID=307959 RepID=A0A673GVT0_9TELE